MITGAALFNAVIVLVIVAFAFWAVWWFIDYVGIPEPFNKALRVITGLAALIFVVNVVLGLFGHQFIKF